jgi:hypothetical protein
MSARNTKELVEQVLSRLPEDATMEDVQYSLYVADLLRDRTDRCKRRSTRASITPWRTARWFHIKTWSRGWHDGCENSLAAQAVSDLEEIARYTNLKVVLRDRGIAISRAVEPLSPFRSWAGNREKSDATGISRYASSTAPGEYICIIG